MLKQSPLNNRGGKKKIEEEIYSQDEDQVFVAFCGWFHRKQH